MVSFCRFTVIIRAKKEFYDNIGDILESNHHRHISIQRNKRTIRTTGSGTDRHMPSTQERAPFTGTLKTGNEWINWFIYSDSTRFSSYYFSNFFIWNTWLYEPVLWIGWDFPHLFIPDVSTVFLRDNFRSEDIQIIKHSFSWKYILELFNKSKTISRKM